MADLPEGATLTYWLAHETWSHRLPHYVPRMETEPTLYIHVRSEDTGTSWTITLVEHDGRYLSVEMFSDSFEAFTRMPEFFTALALTRVTSLDGARALLDNMGATDTTDRLAPKHICDNLRELADELEAGEVRRRG